MTSPLAKALSDMNVEALERFFRAEAAKSDPRTAKWEDCSRDEIIEV